ncbi:N-acetylglucosaminyl-diphospho-decaprenol L-rhamnosyltransferase [Salinivirga cyanobacteriivorans]|uniref:N-acetylglucosaminyl-diphospho-decaprenol L-rhamnosyltransferase n=1 Tax=Salinivirga cyanobacteriivorans TaxID=1307839 RepID=A0A0S2HY01_9BACT|nr:glycosyltransferase family 2 protein [Salinivirga cyanobacteriivorans]ALO14852.1 N-acetylglucosaminyl-diphospho-decaprenol L-rhamnosyltransferase [Salinivirga cyanobacteriivorans]
MKLSVIIVNYNVRHFLRQCLQSVENAVSKINAEVFVVDNNSVDGSVSMVRESFSWVKLIENKENLGFSKANNLAIKQAKGEYVLLLNPDTVVEEDTFLKVVGFMDQHADAGGLGVKMIDGNGDFLPESKRGLPTPMVAFYKIAGLSALFPYSKKFGRYHLKYLDKEKVHEVDVLSGAFMLVRKKVIDEIGGLDETFFMYGEDIDWSYRIKKSGYKNYYFPDTTIIHYKGESTKKESINYVVVFYNAMIIFAQKHFARKYASVFSFLIRLAIMLSAGLAIFKRLVKRLFIPVIDFFVLWGGFWLLTPLWEKYQFGASNWFPEFYLTTVVPLYVLIWIIALLYSGGYDKPYKFLDILKGLGWGLLLLLIVYALLPEHYRFSRVMLLLGGVWATITIPAIRLLYRKANVKSVGNAQASNTIVVGSSDDVERVQKIFSNDTKTDIIGFVSVSDQYEEKALGNIQNIEKIVRVNNVSEVIFSAQHLQTRYIIRLMIKLDDPRLKFKIVSPDGISVIGSSTIHSLDDVYSVEVNAINKPPNRRFKRTLDVTLSLMFILLYPLLFYTVKQKGGLIKNAWRVMSGKMSWVGFGQTDRLHELPNIRKGVVHPGMLHRKEQRSSDMVQRVNMIYAKDYRLVNDLAIVFRLWKHLGG